jgi:hypothetical protein
MQTKSGRERWEWVCGSVLQERLLPFARKQDWGAIERRKQRRIAASIESALSFVALATKHFGVLRAFFVLSTRALLKAQSSPPPFEPNRHRP